MTYCGIEIEPQNVLTDLEVRLWKLRITQDIKLAQMYPGQRWIPVKVRKEQLRKVV